MPTLHFVDYGPRSGTERALLLRRIAKGIENLGDLLIECASRETALPEARLKNEHTRTCLQLRLFADLAQEDEGHELALSLVRHPLIKAPGGRSRGAFYSRLRGHPA